jgi:outer membrane protein TolC
MQRMLGSAATMVVFVVALTWVLAGHAQPAPGQPALSPDDAVRVALANSETVRRAQLDVDIAHIEGTSLSLASPEIQIGHRSVSTLGASQVDPFDDSQLGLSWSPPSLADFGIKQAMGERLATAGLRDVDEVAANVAVEVRTLHAAVLSLRAERALAQERVDLWHKLASLEKRRVDQALATALDFELTSLDILDAQAELADLDGDLVRLEQRLARLLGTSILPALSSPSVDLCTLPATGVDEVLAGARDRSARLKALSARHTALELREARAWLRLVPWVDNLQVALVGQPGQPADVRARVDIAVPLFVPFGSDLRLLSLERERMVAERRAVERDIDEKVRAAWDRLAGFVRIVDVYGASKERLQASATVVERSLTEEVVDTLRVVGVQQRVLNARRQEVRSRARCADAAIALAAAAGRVLPDDVSVRPTDVGASAASPGP